MRVSPEGSPVLRFASVWAQSFRNLAPLDFVPGPCLNVIFGDNGEGKSNLLELIDYLSTLNSFRGARTEELICRGQEGAEVAARILRPLGSCVHRIRLWRRGRREITLDGRRPRSRAAYQQSITTVAFHPASLQLTAGPAEHRRAFMDRVLEQFDPTYSATLSAYQRALRSRNRLLRAAVTDRAAIGAYDELLASAGAVLIKARAALVENLAARTEEAFSHITGDKSRLEISYIPRVRADVPLIRLALERSLSKDLALGYTTEGPHADELAVELGGRRARHYASQGQHRAVVLALKVAELRELQKQKRWLPVLLLDDVSSELDRGTNLRLFELLAQLGAQVFVTTTHPELIISHSTEGRRYWISGGVIREQD